jgi:AAA domain
MKPNPGGQLAADEVLGRDRLISRLWQVLERQSLILTAERRMGKTSVIKKMTAQPLPQILVKFRDLEGLRTPLEFVEAVLQDVQQDLSGKERAMGGVRALLEQLSGAEIKGFKLPKSIEQHWKTILTKTIEDLMAQQEGMVIFFWDEMPMMLDNINRDLGETATMEILTTLRYLRQTHSNLRMVFTGSIGLHHVVTQLKKVGAAGATTNDMHQEEVTPLDLADAILLAQELLTGAKVDVKDLARSIAESVDLVPYYIHHIVDELQQLNSPITQQSVADIILDNLYNPSNRWDMAHYRERIDTYYESPIVPFALGVLDELAVTANPLPLPDLLQRLQVQSNLQNLDREILLKVLSLLQRDHYIGQQNTGAYAFRFPLIQQYWRLSRGLG